MPEIDVFTPLNLKHTQLKNRFVMGSMHTGLEEAKQGFDKLAYFYEQRAKGGVSLIVTGGIAPNFQGRLTPFATQLSFPWQIKKHRKLTQAVHKYNSKICLQILHAGRYAYHPFSVAPSKSKAPITPFKARAITQLEIKKTIFDYANTANMAKKAGYDGVEIMGSEGYFINQFLAPKTNQRTDKYGGNFKNRMRLAIEIVQAIRKKVGDNFIIIFRLSMLEFVEDTQTYNEVIQLAKALEKNGVDLINSGIGWHESRVPSIATMVPRAAFTWITHKVKQEITLPVIASNRINNLQDAQTILKSSQADMISMARPFLADPDFVNKAMNNDYMSINTCIACNQACLDHTFKLKTASCLVNPKACHETEFQLNFAKKKKKVFVIGAGPAGLSAAVELAQRGHQVTLYEARSEIGGQFNIAKEIPGKEEFKETIRYFNHQLRQNNIVLKLNYKIQIEELKKEAPDEVIFATGVEARIPDIQGIHTSTKVLNYTEVLLEKKHVGKKVAIIGAGGIGFDTAEFLAHNPNKTSPALDKDEFYKEWGVDPKYQHRGALKPKEPEASYREIYLLQRKTTKHGEGLGKTTGWIHRLSLKNKGIHFLGGVSYHKIDDKGLHINREQKTEVLDVDHIVICAGQTSNNSFYQQVKNQTSLNCHLIGGADVAQEIDAKRAINQGVRLANSL